MMATKPERSVSSDSGPWSGPAVGARVPSLESPYSGSEGEMLREGFSTVVVAANCGNRAAVRAKTVS